MADDDSGARGDPRGARPLAEEKFERLEPAQIVASEIADLPDRCRAIIKEFLSEGATANYDEMAKRLGIPRGSIGPTRARCFARLRERLVARGVDLARSARGAASCRRSGNPFGPSDLRHDVDRPALRTGTL